MPQAEWKADPDGRYWIDVVVGNRALSVMIDLGLVDPVARVGFELEPAVYHQLKQSGELSRFLRRVRRDAGGGFSWAESGRSTAQLMDPASRQRAGPQLNLYISCGSPGVPSRVGVVFFHHLIGCRVHWDLE